MSSKKESLFDLLLKLILSAVLVVVVILVLLATVFWSGVLTITPQADLPRNGQGELQVNLDNYRHWHTYSKLFQSNTRQAEMTGDFILRVLPVVEPGCEGIKNCKNFQSTFYHLKKGSEKVVLVSKNDDSRVSDFIRLLKEAVDAHNRSITSFDIDVKADFPTPDDFPVYKLSKFEGNELSAAEKKHNQVLKFARNNCRNNGKGCDVRVISDYSFWGYPHTDFRVAIK
ncbi:hypothetical protein [Endozoicomonas acroporae]|uniref:hypothetical protein n=1 Tax=Endozoicomonas acroporae TaxID=1701104 RepID=UPI003D7B2ED3